METDARKYTIKELREAKGWSQLILAIRVGVTPLSVSNWERLKARPEQFYVEQMAELFDVPIDQIAIKPTKRRQTGPDYELLFTE